MTSFEKALRDIDSFCEKEDLKYAIIGGMALIAHGINKTTEDIDITLMLNLEDIEEIGRKILTNFEPIYSNPISFFQTNFVLPVIHKETNIGIDFAAGLTGFDVSVINRRVRKKFYSLSLPFASIEDIIIYKLFAARDKDNVDLKDITAEYKGLLNLRYLNNTLTDFAGLEREDMLENFALIFKNKKAAD